MKHHAHVLEQRLFDCYLARRAGERLDPPVAEHLADCEACSGRFAELAAFMDTLRSEGSAEADAIFTPERLRAQQRQIVRRLEQAARPAKIISFPAQLVRRSMSVSTTRVAPRWMAAAAAAGLVVGVAVGASYNFNPRPSPQPRTLARQAAPSLAPVATRGDAVAVPIADDAFLSDLEVAMEGPHTRELQAFDALTPHVREVGLRR